MVSSIKFHAERPGHRLMSMVFGAITALSVVGPASAKSSELPAILPATAVRPATPSDGQSSSSAASDLMSEVAAQLAPLLPDGVDLKGINLGCTPPAGAVLKAVAPGIARLASRGFVVEFQAGDRTLACGATADAQRQVLIAAHTIAQGDNLSEADFQPHWTDAFVGSIGALNALPGPGPFVAATAIRAGDPILQAQLARPEAVHPGDLVSVIVKNGPVTVRAQLEARSAAAVGETTSVVNPESGMPVTVTVTGEKTAELVLQ
jgi:flagella basal body P-ring formation protein FlgA